MASSTTIYPDGGRPKAVQFDVRGKEPTQEAAARLVGMPFQRTPPSGPEVSEALKWFGIGVGVAVAGWFFGGWVIRDFVGPGVLIFGYGAKFLLAPAMLIFGGSSLCKLFRSARKRKPEDAMKWVWLTAILGDDAVGERFGKPEYALSTLRRIIPDGMPFHAAETADYIAYARQTIERAADRTTARERERDGGWKPAGAQKELLVTGARELYPGVKELTATLTYQDCVQKSTGGNNSNTITMTAAIVELTITQAFVCSGKYWFPYEVKLPMQEISATGEQAAGQASLHAAQQAGRVPAEA